MPVRLTLLFSDSVSVSSRPAASPVRRGHCGLLSLLSAALSAARRELFGNFNLTARNTQQTAHVRYTRAAQQHIPPNISQCTPVIGAQPSTGRSRSLIVVSALSPPRRPVARTHSSRFTCAIAGVHLRATAYPPPLVLGLDRTHSSEDCSFLAAATASTCRSWLPISAEELGIAFVYAWRALMAS